MSSSAARLRSNSTAMCRSGKKNSETNLRELSAQLLRLQDEERRRIARELHDTTGQTLAALKMRLSRLEEIVGADAQAAIILHDVNDLADEALREIRTVSHLLFPPLLEEVGFCSAAQWYVDEFTRRSGIHATVECGGTKELDRDAQLVLFRVLQESLTNVLRHSESERVDIRFGCDQTQAVLCVRDYGKGVSPEITQAFRVNGVRLGVGLAGMKERVRELGGNLSLDSDCTGATVKATVPLTVRSSS